jgi:predicted AlkP superfamily pyrophosphatase or phosphodiesterase
MNPAEKGFSRRQIMSDGFVFPDYTGRTLANLMSSIISARGGEATLYAPLHGLDTEKLASARNIVVVVIDGLGYDYLTRQGTGSLMQQHLHSPIQAVAPPTTAASITTFLTGEAPQQHGLTGWFTWFRELGSVVTVLPFQARAARAELSRTGVTPEQLFGHRPVFDLMDAACYSIMPDWLAESVFNLTHLGKAELRLYHTLDDYVARISETVRAHDGSKYIYAYWPRFDALSHEHGVGSKAAGDHFAALDEAFGHLLAGLSGTESMVLLTADHGFVDTPAERHMSLNDLPDLRQCLQLPLCGEPRLVYCYVRNAMRERFVDFVTDELGHAVELHASSELIERGLFGLGEPHPELAARCGDFTLLLKENYVLTQRLPGETPLKMVGFHGGLSRAEVEIPLLLAEC